MKGIKKTRFLIIGAVVLLTIVFLSSKTIASAPVQEKKGEILDAKVSLVDGKYLSPIFKTDFEFNLAGFAWQGEDGAKISLRFYNTKGWSAWHNPESEDYFAKEGWYFNTEPILTEEASRIQYKLETAGSVEKVKLIYINSPKKDKLSSAETLSTGDLKIIPRANWGADENLRFNGNNKEIWPVQYEWPEKFVIHHTAGSDGGDNPESVLRGIYYWHATVLGWGDIGYNYVIDQNGNIYEGRYGGDGAVGAHVYRTKTCAKSRFGGEEHEADFNKKTIGIAVLGNYENNLTVNEKVKNSLVSLIAEKAKNFNIIPDGNSYLIDNNYPNIVGHKDLDCTACPGKNLYSELGTIRNEALKKYQSLGGIDPVIKATYIGISDKPLTINAGEQKGIWVEFKNDGNVAWRNYKNNFYLKAKNSPSVFYNSDWLSNSTTGALNVPNVAPLETARFYFTVKAPSDNLEASEEFQLFLDDKPLDSANFKITAEITGLPYAASLEKFSIKPSMFTGDRQKITMQFKNKGINAWKKGQIKLNIYDLGEKTSRFVNNDWPDSSGRINFNEQEVKTNELATFVFTLKSPSEFGFYKNFYRLEGEADIIQKRISSVTRVDSKYQAQLISQNIPPAVSTAWRFPAVIKFKNTGLTPWDRHTVLKIYDLKDQISRFYDKSWLDHFTSARLSEQIVKPGEIGTFRFILKSPIQGLYFNRFKLIHNNYAMKAGEFNLITRVDK